jgi:hypothetical protein
MAILETRLAISTDKRGQKLESKLHIVEALKYLQAFSDDFDKSINEAKDVMEINN